MPSGNVNTNIGPGNARHADGQRHCRCSLTPVHGLQPICFCWCCNHNCCLPCDTCEQQRMCSWHCVEQLATVYVIPIRRYCRIFKIHRRSHSHLDTLSHSSSFHSHIHSHCHSRPKCHCHIHSHSRSISLLRDLSDMTSTMTCTWYNPISNLILSDKSNRPRLVFTRPIFAARYRATSYRPKNWDNKSLV